MGHALHYKNINFQNVKLTYSIFNKKKRKEINYDLKNYAE